MATLLAHMSQVFRRDGRAFGSVLTVAWLFRVASMLLSCLFVVVVSVSRWYRPHALFSPFVFAASGIVVSYLPMFIPLLILFRVFVYSKDLSSVVLVSSLSSTPSKRRSVSGRWASSGQAGRSIIGRVELGVDALSAAHWELTEAEKGMQVRINRMERSVGGGGSVCRGYKERG